MGRPKWRQFKSLLVSDHTLTHTQQNDFFGRGMDLATI